MARCEKLVVIVFEGEHDHAVEIDMQKTHRGNKSQNRRTCVSP